MPHHQLKNHWTNFASTHPLHLFHLKV